VHFQFSGNIEANSPANVVKLPRVVQDAAYLV